MAVSDVGKGRLFAVDYFRGLSTDSKPTNVGNGAEFLEMDTGDIYFYNAAGDTWVKGGTVYPRPTDEQTQDAVDNWLDDHPEATTTVEDGAVTTAKLADGAVTDAKLAQSGGVLEALNDLKAELGEITKNKIELSKVETTDHHVTIVTDPANGKVTASGTASGAGYVNITDVITLPAGSYIISPNATNHLYFQVRSTSDVNLGQTGSGTSKTFTLSTETQVRIRAVWTATFNETAVSYPQLETGSSSTYFLPHIIADDDYARYLINLNDTKALSYRGTLANNTDFNNATEVGYYLTGYSSTYVNDPIGVNHRKLIVNLTQSVDGTFVAQFLLNYDAANTILYYRMRTSGSWSEWRLMYKQTDIDALKATVDNAMSDNTVLVASDTVIETSPDNVGIKLTVLSYNVSNYNNGTATYITDAKRTNYKKMLSKINPDIIGLQEAGQYIDSNNSHDAMSYIYRPMFPNCVMGSGGAILAKVGAPDTYDNMAFSNGRNLLYGRYTINGNKLLVVSTHPIADQSGTGIDSNTSIAARLTQYTELMKWVNNEIQLTSQDGLRTKNRPDWDWCIICGDFNTITEDDKDNLTELINSYDFSMANGGWLGWLETERDTAGTSIYSLDNILCSSSVIINSVTAHKSLYADLYSDHYPISADVTLLDVT